MRDGDFETKSIESKNEQYRQRRMTEAAGRLDNTKVPFDAFPIGTGCGAGQCASSSPDPHQLIRDRVDALAREQHDLMILYRALPRELPYEAATVLSAILLRATANRG